MPDAEYTAAKLAEADTEREVQPLGSHPHDRRGIKLVDCDRRK